MTATTDPDEFIKFHQLITKGTSYQPFYFPLNPNSKDPLDGKRWKKNRLTPEQAVKWLQKGHNIGIAGTDIDPLTIIDKDDLDKTKDAKPTLTVISRKRIGEHAFYFTSDRPITKDIFEDSAKQNIATEDYGELRAMWQYVVCAGSYVPVTEEELKKIPVADRINAGKYTVHEPLPVATMAYQELPLVFKQCLQEKREAEIAKRINNENKKKPPKDNKFKSALFDLTIEDVTGKSEDSSARFASMFHGSDTGKNTSISNGVLHCWRHNVSHTPLTTLAVMAGLTECSKAGYGHKGSGSSRVDFSEGEFLFKLWIFAKKERFVPEADPIPTPALVWYAVSSKFCDKDNVVDGWKLPVESYNAALDSLEKSKIVPGRPKILHDSKVCGTCKFCPRGGVGGCRNQENDLVGKKKYTVDTNPSCEKYQPKQTKEKKEKISEGDPELKKAMGIYTDNFQLAEKLQEVLPIYFDESRNFWMWKKDLKYWKLIDETDILSSVQHHSGEYVVSSTLKNEVLEGIRITGRRRTVLPIEKYWLRFNDKAFDLKEKKIFEPVHTHFYTTPIPHNIGQSYETPTIERIFAEWVGEDAHLLYEIASYCLLDDYPIHRMFILFGAGRNGKGQYMDFLTKLVGKANTTTSDLETLMKSRFEAAKLYKKKLVLIGETDFSEIKDTAKLKKITGADMLGGEFKNKNPFDFYNTAKVVISSNSLPETLDKTDAFYGRTIIIQFKNRFTVETPVIDNIPEAEYENLIWNSINHILPTLLSTGTFKNEGSIEEKAKKYEKLSNPFSTFYNKELILDADVDTPVWCIRELFSVFCEQHKFRKMSEKEFTQTLKRHDIETKKRRFGEKTWNAAIGIATKNAISYEVNQPEYRNGNLDNVPLVPDVPRSCISITRMGNDVKYPPQLEQLEHDKNRNGNGDTPISTGDLIEKAVFFLKVRYDKFKQVSYDELGRLTDAMKAALTTEFEDIDDEICFKLVRDYQQTRGWI